MKILKTDYGLRYILCPLKVDYTSISAVVLYGMLDESKPEVAHTLEHMLFGGTNKLNHKSIKDKFDRLSPFSYNASTETDMLTVYTLPVKSKAIETVDLLADILKNTSVPLEILENEKRAVDLEVEDIRGDASSLILPDVYREMFSDDLAEHFKIATQKQIYSITRDEILKDYKRFFVPENIVFTAYGGFKEQEMENAINKGFADLKKGNRNNGALEIKPRGRSRELEMDLPGTLNHRFYMFMPGPVYSVKNIMERETLVVASGILQKRFYDSLRGEGGLVYTVEAGVSSYLRFGEVSVYTESSKAHLGEVKRRINSEIQKIHDGEITKDEIAEEVTRITDSMLIKRYTAPTDSGIALGSLYLASGDAESVRRYGIPEKIHMDDIRAVSSKYFDLGKAVTMDVFDKNQ